MQSLLFFLASWKCQNVDCASFLVHFFNRLWISVESAKISWQKYFQCTDSIIITHKTASPDTTPNAPEYSNCQYKWIRPTTSSYSIANALKFHICTNKNRQLAYYLACSLRQHFLKSQFLCIMSHQWLTHHIFLVHCDSPVTHWGAMLLWNFLKFQRDGATTHQIGSNKNFPLQWLLAQPSTQHILPWSTRDPCRSKRLETTLSWNITSTDIFISYSLNFYKFHMEVLSHK